MVSILTPGKCTKRSLVTIQSSNGLESLTVNKVLITTGIMSVSSVSPSETEIYLARQKVFGCALFKTYTNASWEVTFTWLMTQSLRTVTMLSPACDRKRGIPRGSRTTSRGWSQVIAATKYGRSKVVGGQRTCSKPWACNQLIAGSRSLIV